MANLAYQVTGFAYQGIGQFAYQGSVDVPEPAGAGGGALWAKGRGALNLRRRPLTYSETEELRERLQAIAAAQAASLPMDMVRDDGSVIGDDPFDDDLILQAVLLKVLH